VDVVVVRRVVVCEAFVCEAVTDVCGWVVLDLTRGGGAVVVLVVVVWAMTGVVVVTTGAGGVEDVCAEVRVAVVVAWGGVTACWCLRVVRVGAEVVTVRVITRVVVVRVVLVETATLSFGARPLATETGSAESPIGWLTSRVEA